MPFDNWLNRTFLVWATSMLALVVLSWVTPAARPGKDQGHHLVVESCQTARVRTRAEQGVSKSLPMVEPLHHHYGCTLRFHDVVPILGPRKREPMNDRL